MCGKCPELQPYEEDGNWYCQIPFTYACCGAPEFAVEKSKEAVMRDALAMMMEEFVDMGEAA